MRDKLLNMALWWKQELSETLRKSVAFFAIPSTWLLSIFSYGIIEHKKYGFTSCRWNHTGYQSWMFQFKFWDRRQTHSLKDQHWILGHHQVYFGNKSLVISFWVLNESVSSHQRTCDASTWVIARQEFRLLGKLELFGETMNKKV